MPISKISIYKAINRNEIPSIKIGKRFTFPKIYLMKSLD